MKKIVVATKNKGKIKEIIEYFHPLNVEVVSMAEFEPLPEAVEDGTTFAENALIKAKFYGDLINLPCLADDSGLIVDELQGAPGVYSARYAGAHASDEENNRKLIRELKALNLTKAHGAYACSMALYIPSNGDVLTSEGFCQGLILTSAKGDGGFGYDPYFYVEQYGKTMAEISLDEKNAISHRGLALKAMINKFQEYAK